MLPRARVDRKSTRLNSSHPSTTLFRSTSPFCFSTATWAFKLPSLLTTPSSMSRVCSRNAASSTGRSEEHTSELQSPLHDALPIYRALLFFDGDLGVQIAVLVNDTELHEPRLFSQCCLEHG